MTTAPRGRHGAAAWLFPAPALLGLVVWMYAPMVATGALSFLDWDLTSPTWSFAGAGNYVRLVTQPEFANAVGRTLLYVLAMLPFATVVPLGLAILLWKRPGRASDVYRALLFLPVMLAPVATAISWRFLLNPLQGLVNTLLGGLGLPQPNWLGDPGTALPVIVLITAAKIAALNMLLFGAALTALDRSCLEAAHVDGATEWQTTRHIVLPQLLRTTVLLTLLCVVLAGQWVFTNVAVLTQGGPDGATDNIYYRLYTYGFTFFDIGTASAAGVVIVLVLGLVALVGRKRRART
ncbi:carbohydrate ABC transporter permease [Nonomuraea purpurea]|uniref:Carbohydrate ABC transporter permease n=1 Tax=Nonomuraea purpurea TaxID=1849276 RepID=A0ABV8GI56_9ACTN